MNPHHEYNNCSLIGCPICMDLDDTPIKITEAEMDLVIELIQVKSRLEDAELALYNLSADRKDDYWFIKYFEKYPIRL